MKLSLIVAMDRNGLIGANGGLPWGRIPQDMRLFRELTIGRPVIMGRKTWEGLADHPGLLRGRFPGRLNVVLSRTLPTNRGDVAVRKMLYTAIRTCIAAGHDRAALIGGAQVYAEARDSHWVDSAHVTLIDGEFAGDTWFPFQLFGNPEWLPLAEPRTLAPGVVYHHLGRKPL